MSWPFGVPGGVMELDLLFGNKKHLSARRISVQGPQEKQGSIGEGMLGLEGIIFFHRIPKLWKHLEQLHSLELNFMSYN